MLSANNDKNMAVAQQITKVRPIGASLSLRTGDPAPDAPGLRIRVSSSAGMEAELTLFDTFNPAFHTVIVFSPAAANVDVLQEMLAVIRRQPADAVRTLLVLSPAAPRTHALTDLVVVDGDNHAFAHYGVSSDGAEVTAVVVGPDAMIGAFAQTVDTLEQYFALVFCSSQTVCAIYS
jgi:hypothetical protein